MTDPENPWPGQDARPAEQDTSTSVAQATPGATAAPGQAWLGADAPAAAMRRRTRAPLVLGILLALVVAGAAGLWYMNRGQDDGWVSAAPATHTTAASSDAGSAAASAASSVGVAPAALASTAPASSAAPAAAATTGSASHAPSTTSTPSVPATVQPPAGTSGCDSITGRTGVETPYGNLGVGNDVTTCQFAKAVRVQYANAVSKVGESATVRATSPVTGQTYTMTCTGGRIVTCTGGNDAVVYMW